MLIDNQISNDTVTNCKKRRVEDAGDVAGSAGTPAGNLAPRAGKIDTRSSCVRIGHACFTGNTGSAGLSCYC